MSAVIGGRPAIHMLVALLIFFMTTHVREWHLTSQQLRIECSALSDEQQRPAFGARPYCGQGPGPAIEPYIRPEFAREMEELRPTILAAAHRHNRPELSHMSDHDFAVLIAVLLYNEHWGWLEEGIPPLQALRPLYEDLQVQANTLFGSDLSVWPANIRPSVALEILRHQVPVAAPIHDITIPVVVVRSRVNISAFPQQRDLYAAITGEIDDPTMAVEYLAANLERGLYRAHFEGAPITWRVLAAWHNQGIVSLKDIRANPTASDYIHRASAYFAAARACIDGSVHRGLQ